MNLKSTNFSTTDLLIDIKRDCLSVGEKAKILEYTGEYTTFEGISLNDSISSSKYMAFDNHYEEFFTCIDIFFGFLAHTTIMQNFCISKLV